jgi:hypothetical protein
MDWRDRPTRLLWIVVLFLLATQALDFKLFDWIYWLLGVEKMPWQQ